MACRRSGRRLKFKAHVIHAEQGNRNPFIDYQKYLQIISLLVKLPQQRQILHNVKI